MSRRFVRHTPADNYITYGNVVNATPSMYVGGWVKIGTRNDGDRYTFITKPGSGANGWGLHIISDGRLEFFCFDGTNFDAANSFSTHLEVTGDWVWVAGWRSATDIGVRINNLTDAAWQGPNSGGTPSSTANDLVVGAYGAPPDAHGYDGLLGYFSVWLGVTLTQTENDQLYAGALPTSIQSGSLAFAATFVGGYADTIGPYAGTNSNTTNDTDEPPVNAPSDGYLLVAN